ncbi:hypothetical protein RRG08_062463 [Elysia crispata]|uniref:Uncharacterized protein n=1 Tax=Elysia crispata TaxID=231223 RepID=A0AAE1CJB4_9GAST|nr:hypothetical protein RRG08_062463 [Elysia crispata]
MAADLEKQKEHGAAKCEEDAVLCGIAIGRSNFSLARWGTFMLIVCCEVIITLKTKINPEIISLFAEIISDRNYH